MSNYLTYYNTIYLLYDLRDESNIEQAKEISVRLVKISGKKTKGDIYERNC